MPDLNELKKDLQTHLEHFYHWEKTTPNQIFLRQPFGATWKELTYGEAGQEARKMVTALKAMGLEKGDHIGILSKNCYHWIMADLAIMMGGYVSVPYYASLPKLQLNEVILDSDIKLLFVGKLDKWGDRAVGIPDAVKVIRFPHYEGNAKIEIGEDWDTLVQAHSPTQENYLPDINDLWTILYTSGTTGSPKGVMHPYCNPAMIVKAEKVTDFIGVHRYKNHRYFSFLPLNHVAERIAIELTGISIGATLSFVESLDTFAKNLQDTQPTVIFAVPRIWMKFYQGVTAKMPEKKLNRLLKIPIVSGMIKKKLKRALGLEHAKIVATGAAITPKHLKDWYKKLDIHLIEAYGMTEVCGAISNGPSLDTPNDSVGEACPYCEVKIDPKTNEILMKSPWAMTGYYKDPEKTDMVLKDGWIYSGDRGTIDDKGFLRVIGRVKDGFKTTKGKYIIPNPIEEKLSGYEMIEQVCLTGSNVSQPIALVNLSEQAHKMDKEKIKATLEAALEEVNASLESHEKVSTIIINKENWTEQNEMLTPTLKVRRTKIDDCYCEEYLNWHDDHAQIIWE